MKIKSEKKIQLNNILSNRKKNKSILYRVKEKKLNNRTPKKKTKSKLKNEGKTNEL